MSPPRSIWKSTEVSDYCHVKGMKFGLWVEIERLGAFSAAYAEHPEWRSRDILGRQSENFIDLTDSRGICLGKERAGTDDYGIPFGSVARGL